MQLSNNFRYFVQEYLSGLGLEIGASHCPLPYNVETTKMIYQDRLSQEDRQAEVALHDKNVDPAAIIKPDVISSAECCPFPDNHFDFVCNSHLLEHLANPVKAIFEWLRILKPGGYLYMIIPDMRETFDKDRPLTPADHLAHDYLDGVKEVSLEHYKEVFGDQAEEHYKLKTSFHVHTFTEESLKELLASDVTWIARFGMNIVVLIKKVDIGA